MAFVANANSRKTSTKPTDKSMLIPCVFVVCVCAYNIIVVYRDTPAAVESQRLVDLWHGWDSVNVDYAAQRTLTHAHKLLARRKRLELRLSSYILHLCGSFFCARAPDLCGQFSLHTSIALSAVRVAQLLYN